MPMGNLGTVLPLQAALQVFGRGQAAAQVVGQCVAQPVLAYADGLVDVLQRVAGYHVVFALAEQKADGRSV